MCGRTACSLTRDGISCAANYKDNQSGQYVRCEWFESNQTNDKPMDSYEPHFNQTSGNYLPVLVAKKLLDKTCNDVNRRVLTSMRWGLRPEWIKSSDSSSKLNPINCRFETITEKNTFRNALKSGRRCLVLVDGFFEWKTNIDNTKDPYFLYFPQKYVDFKTGNNDWIQNEVNLYSDNQWKGPRLLTIAGLFNISDDKSLTFTIITVPNHPSLEWLHNRMPAILDSEEAINDWLNFENVSADKALQLLVPFGRLEYHSVSRLVSNVRNNSIENLWPQKPKTKQKTIDHWFKPKDITKSKKSIEDIKEEEKTGIDGKDGIRVKKLKQEIE